MRIVLIWLLVVALHREICWGDDPAIAGAVVLPAKKYDQGFHCEAILRVAPGVVARSGTVKLKCEVRCTRNGQHLYNPFLSEKYPLPAQIVITSVDGKLRREVLRPAHVGEFETPRAWMMLRDGESFGREFTIRIAQEGKVENNRELHERIVDLPNGEYYVQAIYNYWLIAPGPSLLRDRDEPLAFKRWDGKQIDMDQALAVSEPVKLVVQAEAKAEKVTDDRSPIRMELRPPTIQAKVGHKATLHVRMINQSHKTTEVYNPTLNGFLWNHRAAALAILDGDGNYIGDLFHRSSGSSVLPSRSDWMKIPPGGFVSSEFGFQAGAVPNAAGGGDTEEIAAGTYILELRAYGHLVSGRPDLSALEAVVRKRIAKALSVDESKVAEVEVDAFQDETNATIPQSFAEWEQTLPGVEFCKSERVKLVILPRTGE